MSMLLLDSSVIVKWFHHEGEQEVGSARAILSAHLNGTVDVGVLDLGLYEIGNILLRRGNRSTEELSTDMDSLAVLLGAPIPATQELLRPAAQLAVSHQLTFYDAAWAAAAIAHGRTLVSADRALLAAGLAESATDCVTRLRLG